MNSKIFSLIQKNLQQAFNLPKYQKIFNEINENTVVEELPWTPARYRKFKDAVEGELQLDSDFMGTIGEIAEDLDQRYLSRFFGEIWKPRTDEYQYTGWQLVEEINKHDPKNVLDVGCGYHPFKGRIPNLVGIDPYNNCADYQVDILEYAVKPNSHDHILALGSINFGSEQDIELRFAKCVELLMQGGKFYLRANPGISHKTGPYVEIYPWSFAKVKELEERFSLKLLEFKKDANNRLYFVYQKN